MICQEVVFMFLNSDVKYIKGVGEARAKSLEKLGIKTLGDMLTFYPRKYEDWSKTSMISECAPGEVSCVKAKVIVPPEMRRTKNGCLVKTLVSDSESLMSLTFFNNKYVVNQLHEGEEYLFYGKVTEDMYLNKEMLPEVRSRVKNERTAASRLPSERISFLKDDGENRAQRAGVGKGAYQRPAARLYYKKIFVSKALRFNLSNAFSLVRFRIQKGEGASYIRRIFIFTARNRYYRLRTRALYGGQSPGRLYRRIYVPSAVRTYERAETLYNRVYVGHALG